MKRPHLIAFATSAVAAVTASAQLFTFAPNVPIPDPTGVADFTDLQTVTTSTLSIADLNVRLVIAGDLVAANGDFYVALSHDSGFAVLLNRTGRRTGQLRGYSDNGFDITLDDQASQGDIHVYRLTLFGIGSWLRKRASYSMEHR